MLPLTDFLYKMLKDRWQQPRNEYVIEGTTEKYPYLHDVRHQVELVTESSGVKFMLHDLRRTFLTTIADTLLRCISKSGSLAPAVHIHWKPFETG